MERGRGGGGTDQYCYGIPKDKTRFQKTTWVLNAK